MKKVIVLVSAALLSMGIASAQDFEKATNLAKEANEALVNGDFKLASENFKAAAAEAAACAEDDAQELVATCKKGYTQAQNAYAQALYKAGQLEEAIQQAGETVKVAAENGEEEIKEKAQAFKLQLHQAYANAKMKAAQKEQDAAAKVSAYKAALENLDEVLENNPAAAKVVLQKGQVLSALGKKEEAVAAFEKAKELGEADAANKQLSTIYLKEAQGFMKAQKYKEAVASALKSADYLPSANAYKIAGISAGKAQDYKAAVANLEKYLQMDPAAKDAEAMKAAIAGYKPLIK